MISSFSKLKLISNSSLFSNKSFSLIIENAIWLKVLSSYSKVISSFKNFNSDFAFIIRYECICAID